jgi:hypothetical protein
MNFIDTRPSQLFPILTVAQIAIVAGVVPRCFAPVDSFSGSLGYHTAQKSWNRRPAPCGQIGMLDPDEVAA